MIITIDGPTASGKSTIARQLAKKLEYLYINSGLLFRAVAYTLDKKNISPSSQELKTFLKELLTDELRYEYSPEDGAQIWYENNLITPLLKTPTIDTLSSQIATQPVVRDALLTYQRHLAQKHNVIADGRDCGTIVFPTAKYKFFITASLEVRAQRWQKDQEIKGNSYTLEESIRIIDERDTRDSQRSLAPLVVPENAHIIDTSDMNIDEAVQACLEIIK